MHTVQRLFLLNVLIGVNSVAMDMFPMRSTSFFQDKLLVVRHKSLIKEQRSIDGHLSQKLLTEVEKGSLASINQVLQRAPGLLCRSPYTAQKALCIAIKKHHHKSIALLLDYNANPHMATDDHNSILHFIRDSKTAQIFINHGVEVNQKNKSGRTPFFSAMKRSSFDVAQVLLVAGADINDSDNEENSPLHQAVVCMKVPAIKFLLYNGADADKSNKAGDTAYQMGLRCGGDVLQVFEECKKVMFVPENDVADAMRFDNGSPTVLIKALLNDDSAITRVIALDESGYCSSSIASLEAALKHYKDTVWADLESYFLRSSTTSIRIAQSIARRSADQQELLHALCNDEFGKAVAVFQKNPYVLHTHKDETFAEFISDIFAYKFLLISEDSSDYALINTLLHSGFDLNVRDNFGRSLLFNVIKDTTSTRKYRDLLRAGVSVNALDTKGKSALLCAIILGDEDKVKTLLSYGAVVDKNMCANRIGLSQSLFLMLHKALSEQSCFTCKIHKSDMSNIPCVNRHIGYFICQQCYTSGHKHCPMCRRSLDEYGA